MKRITLLTVSVLLVAAILAPLPSLAASYAVLEHETLRQWREQRRPILLVDIQEEEEYFEHHFEDSVRTGAYPVSSDKDTAKLRRAVKSARSSTKPVVVVSTKGGDEASRAGDFLVSQGVPANRLYILKGGIEGGTGKPVCDCCRKE